MWTPISRFNTTQDGQSCLGHRNDGPKKQLHPVSSSSLAEFSWNLRMPIASWSPEVALKDERHGSSSLAGKALRKIAAPL